MEALICTHARPRVVGELCIGGDWAQAHGDFGALRHIAQQLAGSVHEPVRGDLVKLADLCLCDLERAGALWDRLKASLRDPDRQWTADGGLVGVRD